MKKLLFAVICGFTAFSSFAQINYESGYIVDNNGNRNSVVIRNVDWRNNPTEIEYKTSEASEVKTASVENIREFGIGEDLKYVRHTVRMDQSSDNLNNLSRTRNPEFKEETVLLKVLIEGQADLYEFKDDARNRFLYSINEAPVEQLVYKQYKTNTGNQKGKNNYFQQQLLNDLKCGDLVQSDVTRLDYRKVHLKKYFKKYNECTGFNFLTFEEESGKGELNFSVKGGVNFSILEIYKDAAINQLRRNFAFGRTINPRLGFEGEYVMPFNKNKWSVFLEATYEQLDVEEEYYLVPQLPSYGKSSAKISYQSVAFPLGLRHYFYLTENSRVFVSGAYIFNYYFHPEGNTNRYWTSEQVEFTNKSHGLEIALGFNLNKRYSIEGRYGTGRDVFSDYSNWKTSTSNVYSLMIGYTIF